MLELMNVSNKSNLVSALRCFDCSWIHTPNYIAAKRYFRKGSGGTTIKCRRCGLTNFIILNFKTHPNGVFELSKANQHIE